MHITREGAFLIGVAVVLDYEYRCNQEQYEVELEQQQKERERAQVRPRVSAGYKAPVTNDTGCNNITLNKAFIFFIPVLKELAAILPWERIPFFR